MDTIELVVYLVIAIIAGSLILVFVADISPGDMYTSMRRSFFGDDELSYKKVPAEDFAAEAYQVWERCGLGAQEAKNTLYVTGNGQMNMSVLFSTYKKLNLCSTIQSQSQSCGSREDVNITRTLTLPAVINVRCDPVQRQLFLS